MTPEFIRNSLFFYSDVIQQFHHDTKSHAEHETLGAFYEKLLGYRDEIPEKLIGYLGNKRLSKLKLKDFPESSSAESVKVCKEIIEFAYELYEWAGKMKYCDIENKAQELSGDAAQTLYRLSQT